MGRNADRERDAVVTRIDCGGLSQPRKTSQNIMQQTTEAKRGKLPGRSSRRFCKFSRVACERTQNIAHARGCNGFPELVHDSWDAEIGR